MVTENVNYYFTQDMRLWFLCSVLVVCPSTGLEEKGNKGTKWKRYASLRVVYCQEEIVEAHGKRNICGLYQLHHSVIFEYSMFRL